MERLQYQAHLQKHKEDIHQFSEKKRMDEPYSQLKELVRDFKEIVGFKPDTMDGVPPRKVQSPPAPPQLKRDLESNRHGRYTQLVGEYIAAEVKRQERKKANVKRVVPQIDKKWFNLAIFKPDAEFMCGAAEVRAQMEKAEKLRTKKG